MEERLESLKEQLLIPLLSSIKNAELIHELRWVANEATALAWFTVCPMLVLPALLEEKISGALQRWEHQQQLWKRQGTTEAIKEEVSPAPHWFRSVVMAA
jgi:hypothetical protein